MSIVSAFLNQTEKFDVTFKGFRPQRPDARDAAFAFRAQPGLLSAAALPPKHDNLDLCSPVEAQGTLGSCTAQTVVGLVEANENRQRQSPQPLPEAVVASQPDVTIFGIQKNADGSVSFSVRMADQQPAPEQHGPFVNGSRLFHYYATRKLTNQVSVDSGATMRDAIKAAAQFGVVDESLWPYDIARFKTNPPTNVWAEAAKRKVTSYHAIANGDLHSLKAALVDRWLVGFGFLVYPDLLSAPVATTGLLPMPKAGQRALGGHAVALVGYDDDRMIGSTKGAFLVRNSWGANWGIGGYFWMPYDYVRNPALAMDFWVVQSAPL